jgi:hypothetical protein
VRWRNNGVLEFIGRADAQVLWLFGGEITMKMGVLMGKMMKKSDFTPKKPLKNPNILKKTTDFTSKNLLKPRFSAQNPRNPY